jgi:hypothetical protein
MQERLLELLKEGQPWKAQGTHQLLDEEFNIEYHPDYLGQFLRNLGLSYAKPRPKRLFRPENADKILEERVADAFDEETETVHNKRPDDEGRVLDDDICTDRGTVVGFVMLFIRNHTTIHIECGTSMNRHCNDR